MKFIKFFIILFISCFLLSDQEKIQEEVSVVNVEVPVRVYFKGEPVPNLTKNDFMLYADGQLTEINGFTELKRKIQVEDVRLETDIQRIVYKPRLFVLIFNFTDIHTDIDKNIDYLFDKVLRKNDHLMVMANKAFVPEKVITDLKTEKEALKGLLKKDSRESQLLLMRYSSQAETLIRLYKTELAMRGCLNSPVHPETKCARLFREFLEKYYLLYKQYKKTFLIPDINRYYAFAKYLEKVKTEKWVINFYQYERFLKLKLDSQFRRRIDDLIGALFNAESRRQNTSIVARTLQKTLWKVDMEMNVADEFPVKEIGKLFMKINTTFHTIFMRSLTPSILEDFDYKTVSSNIENSLREITRKTNGEIIGSNNLRKSLEKISHKEDILYLLTFEPEDDRKDVRKIRIKMKNKAYKLIYDNEAYAGFFTEYIGKKEKEIPKIKIKNFAFQDKVISFTIFDYKKEKTEDEEAGKFKIRIRVSDNENTSLYDQTKSLTSKKGELNLSIGLKWLDIGEYNVIIDYTDLLTGTSDTLFKSILIL
ncbi:hypothetical protein ACFLRB_00810 [Acidobacteriota bacterium]